MFDWNDKTIMKQCLQVLQDDKIVLAQSDTVLGLFGCLSVTAKNRLDYIKKRNLKPYIILIQSENLLSNFIDQDLDEQMQKIIATYWPGPLTIIFKAKSTLPDWMIGADKTVALRVPKHEVLEQLLTHFDGLFTTSANISDQPLPASYKDIHVEILQQVGMVCCNPDYVTDVPASTILDFSSGVIKIIRLGAIKLDSI